jgi:para-nitrobenzyl esterase
MCLQTNDKGPGFPPQGDESCLFLNIWSPQACMRAAGALPSEAHPGCAVLLWVHGGGYNIGSGINYDGMSDAALAGDVIYVTINYRLGALGFLAAPELAAREAASSAPGGQQADVPGSTGNFGLLDQRAAMQWVRDNIHAFGGDGGRLTIAGESAGAGSVTCHLCNPASRALFSSAVMESGAFAYWVVNPMSSALQQHQRLLQLTGCGSTACLISLDARNLTAISSGLAFANRSGTAYAASWAPTVDGVIMDTFPWEALKQGRCGGKPVLLGVNRDEGTLGAAAGRYTKNGYRMTEIELGEFFSLWSRGNASLAGEFGRAYAVGSDALYGSPYWAATHFVGDLFFTCPTRRACGPPPLKTVHALIHKS